MSLQALTAELLAFRDERNWAAFHDLRNLIVSLSLEASELLELTQWKSDAEIGALASSASGYTALADECADVLIYLLLIAEKAGIDLEGAAYAKLAKNAQRYPVATSYGSRRKHGELAPQHERQEPQQPPTTPTDAASGARTR